MRVIGHRGACGYAPENTLASIELAIQLDVDMIEFDVHALKTGDLVIIHDDTVDATTDGTGFVTDFDTVELRRLNAGGGLQIPFLHEGLDLINKRKPVNAEIKGRNTARPLADLLRHYIEEEGWSTDNFLVTSEKPEELDVFIDLLPDIRTGLVYPPGPTNPFLTDTEGKHIHTVTLNAEYVSEADVRMAHQHGLEVNVYTVNDLVEAERLAAMGVDAIFSNYPDKVRGHIGESVLKGYGEPRARREVHVKLAVAPRHPGNPAGTAAPLPLAG